MIKNNGIVIHLTSRMHSLSAFCYNLWCIYGELLNMSENLSFLFLHVIKVLQTL